MANVDLDLEDDDFENELEEDPLGALFADPRGWEGVCRSCGCTEDAPCEGGCIWATPQADLCSRCAREDS